VVALLGISPIAYTRTTNPPEYTGKKFPRAETIYMQPAVVQGSLSLSLSLSQSLALATLVRGKRYCTELEAGGSTTAHAEHEDRAFNSVKIEIKLQIRSLDVVSL
jgi:hypothetical protein